MNPRLLLTLFSFRKEITYVFTAFLLAILLPIIAVIVITRVGIDAVSDRLVEYDTVTGTVLIKNPKDGSVYKEITGPFAWPVKGVITLEFGESSIFQPFHTGIDIANPDGKRGDPITPFMPGKVVYAGRIFWGFAKHIVVDHGDNLASIYAHLDTINVERGQDVAPGNVIGTEGRTGWTTGNHLHFQINVFGIPVNPRVFLGSS